MIAVLRFLFVIPLSFVFACLAGSFALLWPFIDRTRLLSPQDPLFLVETAVGFFLQAGQVGSTVLMPWAAFMVMTELFGWRSILLHMAAGVGGGFAVMRVAYGPALPHQSVQTAMIVAGLGFMLVYWILAGRSAGRWRGTVRTPPQRPVDRPSGP